MSGWAPKRFWKEARVAEVDGGWTVTLDGRKVRTPAKADFVVPTRALAESCAAEWAARINSAQTTSVNSLAIDRSGSVLITHSKRQHWYTRPTWI